MFTRPQKDPDPLDAVIDGLLETMSHYDPDSEEYSKMTDQLVKLYKLKKETTPSKRPSADTLALIAANLTGILIIIGHERAHIITTKAFGFLAKLK
jgi:hypothetical protein